jgi:serine protease Do
MNRRTPFTMTPPFLALIIGASLVGGAGSALAIDDALHPGPVAPAISLLDRGAGHSLADMVQAVGPSVVQIQVRKQIGVQPASVSSDGDEFSEEMQRFFGFSFPGGPPSTQPAPWEQQALGSGFIIDPSGIVLTNNHVVDGATTVTVQMSDGRKFKGHVLGTDPKTDVAVVRIDGKGPFTAVQWGDSDRTRVGDSVFAVGSPFGLGNTVTAGIVSARSRDIGEGPYDDFLQVDAAINSGNSGGPLFDGSGRVIGMNTAIYSPSGGNVGIGFAIPEAMARHVADQIVKQGYVSRGRIGVALQAVTPEIADAMDMKNATGALIARVDLDGPASVSGLREGDILTRFAGKDVKDTKALARMVADAPAGTTVTVAVVRRGRAQTLQLHIGGERRVPRS